MPKLESRRKNRVTISADDLRANVKEMLNRAEWLGERLIVTRHEKPSVAIVSIADLEKIEAA